MITDGEINMITDGEINAFIVTQNVKELNSVYFLSSCLASAAAGILGVTNSLQTQYLS